MQVHPRECPLDTPSLYFKTMTETQNAHPLRLEGILPAAAHLDIGHRVEYVAVLDSTNRLARDLALDGATHGTAVVTDYQEQGRGRRGREWVAPPRSSLLLSFILDIPRDCLATHLVMAVSLAAADAVHDATGLSLQLKWPNDVLIQGRKVAGILGETLPGGTAVVGLGINVNVGMQHLATVPGATSLLIESGYMQDREALILGLFTALSLWYRVLSERPAAVWAAWSRRLDLVGHRVEVVEVSKRWTGTAIAVRGDGGLCIRSDIGTVQTVYAADVSLRPAESFTGD